ncbi:archease [Candidatus Pacearchaeota archaeon]|nr:archease [Candidatus Pacearchaeota archaeon]
MPDKEPFIFLEHTADIKVRITGRTLDEIFQNTVLALASYTNSGNPIKSKKGKVVEVQGTDMLSLMYNFIDELIYLIDAEHFIPSKAQVLLRGNNLKAEIFGDDTKNYNLSHIKAATYAEMSIQKTKNGWEAFIVLDV